MLPETSDEDWALIGRELGLLTSAVQFWVGDWLNDAHQRRRDYRQATRITGLDAKILYDYAWVASRVPPELRRHDLSWTHHRAIARDDLRLDDKTRMLQRACREQWTAEELRLQVRVSLGPGPLVAASYDVCPECGQKVRRR